MCVAMWLCGYVCVYVRACVHELRGVCQSLCEAFIFFLRPLPQLYLLQYRGVTLTFPIPAAYHSTYGPDTNALPMRLPVSSPWYNM